MTGRNLELTFSDKIQRLYYLCVLKTGRILRRLMWGLIAVKHPDKRLHPKHLARLTDDHLWYLAGIEKGQRVCDLGCGSGGHAVPMAKKGATVFAVEKYKLALKKAAPHSLVHYLRADLEFSLPFADHEFDQVVALDVIEHLVNREAFLAEIARILKPVGTVFLSAPNRNTRWKKTARRLGIFEFSDPDHKIEYSRNEFLDALLLAGLTVEKVEVVVFDTPFDGWIDFLGGISLRLYEKAIGAKRKKCLANPDQTTGFRITAGISKIRKETD